MPVVFLSANEADKQWIAMLRRHLKPYALRGVTPWDPDDIPPGVPVKEAIQTAISGASLAILLVSPNFLAEDFAVGTDLHALLSAAVVRGLRIVWIPVSASAYIVTDISEYPPLHDARRPLDSLPPHAQGNALVDVSERVFGMLFPEQATTSGRLVPAVPPVEDLFLRTIPGTSDEQSRTILRLTKALKQRDQLRAAGKDTTAVDKDVYDLRRALRRGHPLRVGDTLSRDRYVLQQALGSGEIATVWLAGDRLERSQVALKVLHPQHVENPERRDRFLRGALAMHKLHHDGIVRIFDPMEEDLDHLYFVMGYVEGSNLYDALKSGRISADIGVAILLRVGEALTFAHRHNLLHRDVKPSNILLDREHRPYLADFDLIAPDVAAGGMGAQPFAAPELFDASRSVDARADVFGLGMTAVFVLTGKTPSRDALREDDDISEFLPARDAVRDVLRRSIAWQREQRFDSVSTFCRALRSAWFGHDRAPPELGRSGEHRLPYVDPPPPSLASEASAGSMGPPLSVTNAAVAVVEEPGMSATAPAVAQPGKNAADAVVPLNTGMMAEAAASPPTGSVTTPGLITTPELIAVTKVITGPDAGRTPDSSRRTWIPLVTAVSAVALAMVVYFATRDPSPSDTQDTKDQTVLVVSGLAAEGTPPENTTSEPEPELEPEPPPTPPDLPREPPPDVRAAVQRTCTADLNAYARQCGPQQREVGSGDRLGVVVVVDGQTGKATVSGKLNATMFDKALSCIRMKVSARRYDRFTGPDLHFERTLLLKP